MYKVLGILVIGILILLTGLIFFLNSSMVAQTATPKNSTSVISTLESPVAPFTDFQASFAVFTNGTFRVFSAPMYHNLSQAAYIESSHPNRVQVKKSGTTWNDFFSTLPFELTADCLTTGTKEVFCSGSKGLLQFYINGVKNVNALTQEIKENDKLLVTFGNESDKKINQQIDRVP